MQGNICRVHSLVTLAPKSYTSECAFAFMLQASFCPCSICMHVCLHFACVFWCIPACTAVYCSMRPSVSLCVCKRQLVYVYTICILSVHAQKGAHQHMGSIVTGAENQTNEPPTCPSHEVSNPKLTTLQSFYKCTEALAQPSTHTRVAANPYNKNQRTYSPTLTPKL